MFSFFHRHHRFTALEERLNAASREVPVLAPKRAAALKERVMTRVNASLAVEELNFEALTQELEALTQHLEPPKPLARHARERLIDGLLLRDQQVRVDEVLGGFWHRKRVASFVMTGMLLLVGTFGYLNQLPVVSAARSSSVTSVQGFAYVERETGLVSLGSGDAIQEGDRITTGGDGWADVLFADDTLLTLGPSTELRVDQLFLDPSNESKTSVQVTLEQGRVWVRVAPLLSNGSLFSLHSHGVDVSAEQKAMFDVVAHEDRLEVRNFSNLVEFEVEGNGSVQEGTLGPSLSLVSEGGAAGVIDRVQPLETLAETDLWVQTNLYKQEEYATLLSDTYTGRWEDHAGVLPDSPLYWPQRGMESIQSWMTWNDEVRFERARALIHRRFSEAALLTQEGDLEAADQAWARYQAALMEFAVDESYLDAVAVLQSNQKSLESVALEAEFYAARETLDATLLLVAPDEASKAQVQLQTAADRLGLTLELIDIGAYELALASLEDYQTNFEDALDQISTLSMEDRKPVILAALDQKLNDLKQLKLIAAELEQRPEVTSDLESEWDDVYGDTLYQLNQLVLHLKDRAVLHLGTFLKDVRGDEAMQADILARLKKTVPLDFEYMELINDLEALYAEEAHEVILVEDALVTPSEEGTLFLDGVQDFGPGSVGSIGLPEDQEAQGE